MLQIFDETGLSPIEPGILVSLAWMNQSQDLAFAESGFQQISAYTLVDGFVDIDLTPGVWYVATFRDTTGAALVGPDIATSVSFAGAENGATVITVPGFISPTHPLPVYAALAEGLLPKGFFSDPGSAPILEALLTGLTQSTAFLDSDTQAVIASERPQMCQGEQLDAFAADFFGPYLLRYTDANGNPTESDADFYARVLLGFGPRCTQPVIQAIVDRYFKLNPSFGSSGYRIFDTYSDPERAAYYGLVASDAQFALLEYFPSYPTHSWYIGQGFLGQNTFLADPLGFTKSNTIPYPDLAAQIDRARAKGTVPIYVRSLGDPYS